METTDEVLNIVAGILLTNYGELLVQRLIATQGNRNEPITYWVVVGTMSETNRARIAGRFGA